MKINKAYIKKNSLSKFMCKSMTLIGTFFIFASCVNVPMRDQNLGQNKKINTIKNPKKIVFIHGMFLNPTCWHEWKNYFLKLGYQVSAPSWPLHDLTIQESNTKYFSERIAQLKFEDVVSHYRRILVQEKEKPILIGHSMGGLISQLLLSEGLASAAIAINSAPPQGVIVYNWSFLKSNWEVINPFGNLDTPIIHNLNSFSYAFVNQQTPQDQKLYFDNYVIPESKRVGQGPTTASAYIDIKKPRGPLLLIAGEKDRIIPPNLNYKNFIYYKNSQSITDFILLNKKDHWLIADNNWKEVAEVSQKWIDEYFLK